MTKKQEEMVKKFEKETNLIIKQLTKWQAERRNGKDISKQKISVKWIEFASLWRQIEKVDICKDEIVQEQYKTVVRNFKFFQDTIQIFKTLPDY